MAPGSRPLWDPTTEQLSFASARAALALLPMSFFLYLYIYYASFCRYDIRYDLG